MNTGGLMNRIKSTRTHQEHTKGVTQRQGLRDDWKSKAARATQNKYTMSSVSHGLCVYVLEAREVDLHSVDNHCSLVVNCVHSR